MKKLTIGIIAHVDAGKTTLAESLLYTAGTIRKLGRVDKGDAFLDTYEQEKRRGITIFSKQAELDLGDMQITLLDTPGHVDFSAEMERTLKVLDYAVLVISGTEKLHGDVFNIWKLLEVYKIPVFIFINKMDLAGADKENIINELKKAFGGKFIDADVYNESFYEDVAVCDEKLLEGYLNGKGISDYDIADVILKRKAVLCYSGSALKVNRIEEFLDAIERYTVQPEYSDEFGARVFKISRDTQGNRLTYLKITGGCLKVKDVIELKKKDAPNEVIEEKIDEIRIYSGKKYVSMQEVQAGCVCAVKGLEETYAGQALGNEKEDTRKFLEPVMSYNVKLPKDTNIHDMFFKLYRLGEEVPELDMEWDERSNEIHAKIMGEVQIEILKNLIMERFSVEAEFCEGRVLYKETIKNTVEGVGHFEPLRHYAEVHLLLEPGEPGSGLLFDSDCDVNTLEKNWQRLIMTHLEEKEHVGVLTGAPITDMKITLVSGKAHKKHTEGGDFRQATYRAVRQGLKKAESVLLEPVYDFRIEVPQNMVGRAMSDIQRMHGSFSTQETDGENSVICGRAPVVLMRDYASELTAYTSGLGRLTCVMGGYEPCHNADEVIIETGYDSERDTDNPTGSVFCSHGAGFIVPWYEVEDYMHLDSALDDEDAYEYDENNIRVSEGVHKSSYSHDADDKELEEIFSRTYASGESRKNGYQKSGARLIASNEEYQKSQVRINRSGNSKNQDKYLLVDGYNIIFAWDELKELAEVSLDSARGRLADILSNYQAYKNIMLILVFDAYKVKGGQEEVIKYDNIYIVYTREAETADQYIERTTHKIGKKYDVTVATSDALEQLIVMGHDAKRISARGLKEEIDNTMERIREHIENS